MEITQPTMNFQSGKKLKLTKTNQILLTRDNMDKI